MTKDVLAEALDSLIHAIEQAVRDALSNGSLVPDQRMWIEWNALDFEYTDDGVVTSQLVGTQIPKPDWVRAIGGLQPLITGNEAWTETLDELKRAYPGQLSGLPGYLDKFSSAALGVILSASAHDAKVAEFAKLRARFLNDLAEGPITHVQQLASTVSSCGPVPSRSQPASKSASPLKKTSKLPYRSFPSSVAVRYL